MNLRSENRESGFCQCRNLFAAGALLIGQVSFAAEQAVTLSRQQPQLGNLEAVVSGVRANMVEGDVFYKRADGTFSLDPGLELEEGDLITSGPSCRAELLLQPGNYLRVSGEAELRLLGEPYDRLRLQLNKGAIGFELVRHDYDRSGSFFDRLEHDLIRVLTPNAEVFLTPPGIVRVNVGADGRTEVVVRKGEALINGQRIKEKRSALEAQGVITISENDPKIEDVFDTWCRGRADELIQANRSLKKDAPWVKARKSGSDAVVDLPTPDEQSGSPYVVSAKPGAVNFVESGVEFSQAEREWQPLTDETKLESGDKLRTSAHSHVELGMLPDIYLRLDGSSEILLERLSNDAISLKLINGSAILDAATFDRKHLPQISIGGSSGSVVVAEQGNYRVDVRPGGDEITIREGKVVFRERSVGSCRRIGGGTVTECDKKRTDSFDFWSRHRGEGQFINGRAMATRLARLRRSRFKSTGFWYQPPGLGYYTFVPFFSTYFRSPYGGSYSSVLSPRRVPMLLNEPRGRSTMRFPGPVIAPP